MVCRLHDQWIEELLSRCLCEKCPSKKQDSNSSQSQFGLQQKLSRKKANRSWSSDLIDFVYSTWQYYNMRAAFQRDRVHHLFRNKWKGSTKLSSYDPDCSLQFDQKLPGIVTDADWEGLRDEIGSKVKCQKVKLVEEDMQGKTFFYGSNPKTHFDTNTTKPSLILPSTSRPSLTSQNTNICFVSVSVPKEQTANHSFGLVSNVL